MFDLSEFFYKFILFIIFIDLLLGYSMTFAPMFSPWKYVGNFAIILAIVLILISATKLKCTKND